MSFTGNKTMISIVLPTYNEAQNISKLIPEIEKIISENKLNAEILIVDDKSPDGTAEVARKFYKTYKNIRVVIRAKKEGIGAALKDAYDIAKGEVILSMDADFQLNPKEIPKILKYFPEYDFVIGSKYLKPEKYRRQKISSLLRYLISRNGNLYLSIISGVPIKDFSLNFRAFKKEVWRSIKANDKENFFLVEMILQAYWKGFKIKEVAVAFEERHHGFSKTRVANQIFVFLFKGAWIVIKHKICSRTKNKKAIFRS
ncbi:MAG: glycosyltransferase [Candidatus Diapherotrites archaeon]